MADHQLQVDVEELSTVKKKLNVSIPVPQVAAAISRAYTKLQREAKIRGFRQGKVPRPMLEQQYAQLAREEAIELLVKESYPEAVTTSGLTPLSRPAIEPGPLLENATFRYAATVEVRPVVAVKHCDGLALEGEEVVVEADDIEAQLLSLRHNMTKLVPVDDGTLLAAGMVARVDFSGTADGKSFEGSDAKDFVLDVGSGNVLPDFERQVVGMKMGDTRAIAFLYPEDYFNMSLAGSQAAFSVTVKDLKRKVIPEPTDDFAQELGEYQTLAELRTAIERQLKQRHEQDVRTVLGQRALEQMLTANPCEIPESMIGWELQSMFQQVQEQLRGEGRTIEDVGLTPEAFVAEHEATARTRVHQRLVLEAIATEQKFAVTDGDVEARLRQIAESAGETLPKVRLYYEQNKLIDGLKMALLQEKALDFVLERAKIKIKKVKKEKKRAKNDI